MDMDADEGEGWDGRRAGKCTYRTGKGCGDTNQDRCEKNVYWKYLVAGNDRNDEEYMGE